MNRRIKVGLWAGLVLAFTVLIAAPGDAWGKPRSSSSRSRPSARRSAPSKPRAASKQKASKRVKSGSSSNKGFGKSTKKAGKSKSKKKASKADAAAYNKAKSSGKAHPNRKAAAADFKKKNASKYGSKYTSKPTRRPSHIPQNTMVNGTSTTIIYNQGGGGYGYMNSLGTFMLYNAMADVAMRPYYDRQMMNSGYIIGPPVVYRRGYGLWYGLGGLVLVIVVVGVFMPRPGA